MLKKENRLNKDKEFDIVFKKGKSVYNSILGVKALKNNLKHSRIGIVVSTKVSKKAVSRNKIKRNIREVFKQELDNIEEGYDILFLALPSIMNPKTADIEQSIKESLKKLRLYK